MFRLARSPQWAGALLVAVCGAVLCTLLGRWQWDKSQGAHGDLQNLVYSFNWWLFAAMCLGVWGKALHDEALRLTDPEAGPIGTAGARIASRVSLGPVSLQTDDPEVDEWNAWLAELGSRDRRAR